MCAATLFTVFFSREEVATFAAGCFWGVELTFQRIPGVLRTSVGYAGGHAGTSSYRAVSGGRTGHAEAVQIVFDPDVVSYEELLAVLWERHDATTKNRQGADVGTQYRSAIFYHSERQRVAAEASKGEHQRALGAGGGGGGGGRRRARKVVTDIVAADGGVEMAYHAAEDYHQQYLEKGGQSAGKGETARISCYG